MSVSAIQRELEAERDQVLAEVRALAAAGGIPADHLPSEDPSGERVTVALERGRRVYALYFEDRGFNTLIRAPTQAEFLEQVFRRATSRMADKAHRSRMAAGLSPSEVRFEIWADLLSGVRTEWGDRLRRSKGELLGLPGSLKL